MLNESPVYAYVPISNIERGRHFYEDVLEFKPQMQIPNVGVTYQSANETAFFMYLSDGAGTNAASTAFWMVDDLEKTVTGLKERGIEFIEYDTPRMKTNNGIFESSGSKAAWFKDPDGNVLALIQEL